MELRFFIENWVTAPEKQGKGEAKNFSSLLISSLVDDTAMEKGFSESFVDK